MLTTEMHSLDLCGFGLSLILFQFLYIFSVCADARIRGCALVNACDTSGVSTQAFSLAQSSLDGLDWLIREPWKSTHLCSPVLRSLA